MVIPAGSYPDSFGATGTNKDAANKTQTMK
jgi:hypothetical protein